MDEIKNTTEVEEVKATAECVNPETTDANAEAVVAANETAEAEPGQPQKADPASKADVIERLKQIVYEGPEKAERQELDRLKMLYYRFHNAEVVAAKDKFVAEGGAPEAFMPAPDTDEENFKAQLALIREMRNKAAQEAERERQENLKRKQQVIERFKELSASPDEADKGFDEAKKLQAEWKEIGQVPAENATELWKNYQLYVEQFYDQLRLNHEMRAYDFKKNLEIKTRLCEAAEKLADVEDPVSAFHQLQKLHQEFREVGPVAKELRESVWKRFKDASTVVNKRHQDHFDNIKARDAENLQHKTDICLKIEALPIESAHTHAAWNEMTRQVLDLQAEWKTLGFGPRKAASEVFERFRVACDRFFQVKTAYYKQYRDQLSANLAVRHALIEKAEALKESSDWNATTQKLIDLQREWKAAPPVAAKFIEPLWKRFNEACNQFFHRKNEAFAGQRKEEEANLARKKELLAELEQLAAAPADNALQRVRELQARWNEVGHVPFNKKEKVYRRYHELCDTIYNALHESAGKRRIDHFRRAVADKGGSELQRERTRLQNALEAKKQEIKNYETNLTFFRSSSQKGNSLLADVERRIERLKKEQQEITLKIKAIDEQ